MTVLSEGAGRKLWFGTENYMQWMPVPTRGASTGSEAWNSGGGTLNGGGFQLNSFGSHRNYSFDWPVSSSARDSQIMKSYYDGSYGRGLVYFVDPLIYHQNVFPAMWADPSMGIGSEGASLVYGVDPVSLPTSGWEQKGLPVRSASYGLNTVAAGWRGKTDAVFIPIPEGYTLSVGAVYSRTGTGGVFFRTQSRSGALGPETRLVELTPSSEDSLNTNIQGLDVVGAWFWVGRSSAAASSVTLSAITGRLIESAKTVSELVATNLFTNPNLVGDGTWAEVRRNLCTVPVPTSAVTFTQVNGALTATDGFAGHGSALRHTRTGIGPARVSQRVSLAASTTYSLVMQVRASETLPGVALSYRPDIGSGSGAVVLDTVTIPSGVSEVRVSGTTSGDAPSGDVGWALVWSSGTVGSTLDVTGILVESGATAGRFFDGSTTPETAEGVVQPENFRWRWLGEPNASESVMEIERVRGLTAAECVAGVSTKDGKPAVRLIPTGASVYTRVTFSIPVAARSAGTLVGTVHQDAPISPPLASPAERTANLLVLVPEQRPVGLINEAGSRERRIFFSGLTGTYSAILYHGGSQGSGDVWWTDVGLFAGVYDGPAFSGSSGNIIINGRQMRTQWDGTVDNSTSSAWTLTPDYDKLKNAPWVGGQGHSGCKFTAPPTEIKYGPIDGGQVGFSATFKEVGSWLNG